MEVGQDARTDQHLLLGELRDAVAQVQNAALPANAHVLLTALQLALSDGLRRPDEGFWPAVSAAVHAETRRLVEATASPRRRGRAWLRLALAESSLGAHLRLLAREPSVRRAYRPGAAFITRAPQLAALCDALPDLSLALGKQEWECGGGGGPSPSNSVPSPGDSGVALTDSDADAGSLIGWDDRRRRGSPAPVVRRPRRRKCKAKRVSFHDQQTSEFTAESTTESVTESNTESVTESTTDSTTGSPAESATESDCTEMGEHREERGDPEGQEDLGRQCTPSLIPPTGRQSKAARAGPPIPGWTGPVRAAAGPSRSGLVARPALLIAAATRDSDGNAALEAEIRAALANAAGVASAPGGRARNLLLPGEKLYKVFKVHSCPAEEKSSAPIGCTGKERCPLVGPVLAVLTNHRLCVASPDGSAHVAIDLDKLSAMLVLPGEQGVLLAGPGDQRLLLVTGDEQLTNELAASVSMATLRSSGGAVSVGYIPMATIVGRKSLLEGERVRHVSRVVVEAAGASRGGSPSPLGPALRGSLMVQAGPGAAWAVRYVSLKAGVLYEFESESSALPLRWHALASLQRCERMPSAPRPHSFLLRWHDAELRLAAADQQQASHWLDHIVAAAHVQEWEGPEVGAGPRWLALTNRGRLFVGGEVAELSTLHSLRLATLQAHSCQLEWDCREAVQDSSDDWLLHFASTNQLQAFVSALTEQWQTQHKTSLPLTELDPSVLAACQDARFSTDSAWD